MELSSDIEMKKAAREAQRFFKEVLYDEEPLFVSDEASIFDVSTWTEEELSRRCSKAYGKSVSAEDLKQPCGSFFGT